MLLLSYQTFFKHLTTHTCTRDGCRRREQAGERRWYNVDGDVKNVPCVCLFVLAIPPLAHPTEGIQFKRKCLFFFFFLSFVAFIRILCNGQYTTDTSTITEKPSGATKALDPMTAPHLLFIVFFYGKAETILPVESARVGEGEDTYHTPKSLQERCRV